MSDQFHSGIGHGIAPDAEPLHRQVAGQAGGQRGAVVIAGGFSGND